MAALVVTGVSLAIANGSLVRVSSISMENTLCPGDYLIVTGVGILWPVTSSLVRGHIDRGDVVVVRKQDPDHPNREGAWIVKRVVALGGDTVRISRGELYVNGVRTTEPYAHHGVTYDALLDSWPSEPEGEGVRAVRVPDDSFFLLGDNRDESKDSRATGTTRSEDLIGVVLAHMHAPGSAAVCG